MQTHQELRSEIACQVYGLLPKAIGCIPSANHDCRMHNLNSSRSSLSSGKLLSIVLPSVIDWHQSCKWQIFFHLLGRSLGSRRILGFTLKLKPLLPRASERGGGREGGGRRSALASALRLRLRGRSGAWPWNWAYSCSPQSLWRM